MELSKKNVLNVFPPFLWWNSAKELIRGKAAPAHRGYYTVVRRYWFYFRVAKQWARSIQPKFPEISVQNSMNRFGPTGKVSKKRVHLLRWTTFPGWTGWNFGWMDRAQCDFVLCRKQWKFFLRLCTIFQEIKRVAKAKIAQNISQVAEGGIMTVKPGQDSIHELIMWKVNVFALL